MPPNTAFLAIYLQLLGCLSCLNLKPPVVNLNWSNCVLGVAGEHFHDGDVVVLIDFRHGNEISDRASPQHLQRVAQGLNHRARWSVLATDDRSVCHWKWNSDDFASFNPIYKVQHIFLGNAEHVLHCVPHVPPGWFKYGCLFSADMGDQNITAYERTVGIILELISKRKLNCKLIVTTRTGTINVFSWLNLGGGLVPLLTDTCNNGTLRKRVFSPTDKAVHRKRDNILRLACVDAPPMLCKTKFGDFDGVELEPFKILRSHYNFSMDLIEAKPPEGCNQVNWDYALAMVEEGEADLTLGQFVALKSRMHNYRHSYPLYLDTVLWYVTKDNSYTSTAFNEIMFTELWVIYLATACGMHIISLSADLGMKKHKIGTLFMVWALFTEQPVPCVTRLTRKQSTFWAIAAFVAMNVNVLRKSLQVASLNNMMYTQNISTLKDVINSDIPIVYGIPKKIFGLEKEEFSRISPRLFNCPDFPQCIRRLNISRPFAVAVFKTTMSFITMLYPATKDSFVLLDGEITGIHINTYSRWTLPISDDLDRLMIRVHEVGLFHYWKSRVLREKLCDWKWLESGQDFWADHDRPDAARELRDSWVRAMSKDYLLNAIKILIFGYFCAAFALLGEFAYHVGVERCVIRPFFRFFLEQETFRIPP